MKLLFVIPYMPNPIRVRPFNILRALAIRDHDITLATLVERAEEWADVAVLAEMGVRVLAQPLSRGQKARNLLRALPTGEPLQARYCWQPQLAASMERELQHGVYDAVHVEHLRGAAYGIRARQLLDEAGDEGRIPVVWDSVDCISHLFSQAANQSRNRKGRLMARLELPRTRRHEGKLANSFDQVVVTSAADGAALSALASDAEEPGHETRIHVIPNGVDVDYFAPAAQKIESGRPMVVVTGKMSYHANISMVLHLVEEIMPKVWAMRPDVQLYIVGKDPGPALTQLDQTWSAARTPPLPGDGHGPIIVTGYVEDIRPYLQQATVAVAPLTYGAGIQNKVLEALACGAPVVASAQATSALNTQAGRDIGVADGPDAFATAVLGLLDNQSDRRRLGCAGRAYVEAHHSWHANTQALVSIYACARRREAVV